MLLEALVGCAGRYAGRGRDRDGHRAEVRARVRRGGSGFSWHARRRSRRIGRVLSHPPAVRHRYRDACRQSAKAGGAHRALLRRVQNPARSTNDRSAHAAGRDSLTRFWG